MTVDHFSPNVNFILSYRLRLFSLSDQSHISFLKAEAFLYIKDAEQLMTLLKISEP